MWVICLVCSCLRAAWHLLSSLSWPVAGSASAMPNKKMELKNRRQLHEMWHTLVLPVLFPPPADWHFKEVEAVAVSTSMYYMRWLSIRILIFFFTLSLQNPIFFPQNIYNFFFGWSKYNEKFSWTANIYTDHLSRYERTLNSSFQVEHYKQITTNWALIFPRGKLIILELPVIIQKCAGRIEHL